MASHTMSIIHPGCGGQITQVQAWPVPFPVLSVDADGRVDVDTDRAVIDLEDEDIFEVAELGYMCRDCRKRWTALPRSLRS